MKKSFIVYRRKYLALRPLQEVHKLGRQLHKGGVSPSWKSDADGGLGNDALSWGASLDLEFLNGMNGWG